MTVFSGLRTTQFDPGNIAKGSDVLFNDQTIANFLNGNLIDSSNINMAMAAPWTGVHSFLAAKLRVGGAGAGLGYLQYANSASIRTFTIPDPGANDTFVTSLTNAGLAQSVGLRAVTTTTSNDSIKFTSYNSTALSSANQLPITISSDTIYGNFKQFNFQADITLKLSGAHWGIDTTGNLTGAILRVGLINDGSATPALAVYYQGGRNYIRSVNCDSTPTNITLPHQVLVNRVINVGVWPVKEIGYFLADFTDATNVWAIQFGEIWPGKSADGKFQPWNPIYSGFSVSPAHSVALWTQHGEKVTLYHTTASAGTSNSTTHSCTAPLYSNVQNLTSIANANDNSAAVTIPCYGYVTAGSGTIQFVKATGSWTNVGTKYVNFTMEYEAYQP